MEQAKIVEILKEFISGNIQLVTLSEIVDECLFNLRQKPDLTPEQELLSTLELYIHEIAEGYRSSNELYEFVMSIIKSDITQQNSTTIILNTRSTPSELSTGASIPLRDYYPDPLRV